MASYRIIEKSLDVVNGRWIVGTGTDWQEDTHPVMYAGETAVLAVTLLKPTSSSALLYEAFTDFDASTVLKGILDNNYDPTTEPLVRINDYWISKVGVLTDLTDIVTIVAHGFLDGRRVWFKAGDGGALPAGVTEYTEYFVANVTDDTFQITETYGGSAVDFTEDSTAPIYVYYGRPCINIPGDWDDADITAGKISIRLNTNTTQVYAAMAVAAITGASIQSPTDEVQLRAKLQFEVYAAGSTELTGAFEAPFALKPRLDPMQWMEIDADDFTATPASSTTLTMLTDLTDSIQVGAGVRFLIGTVYYFGIVESITAGLLTVTGMTFPQVDSVYTDVTTAHYQVLPADVVSNYLTAAQVAALIAIMIKQTLFATGNSILKADTANTPEELVLPEQTMLGRITGGEVNALTAAQIRTLLDLASMYATIAHTHASLWNEADGNADIDIGTEVVDAYATTESCSVAWLVNVRDTGSTAMRTMWVTATLLVVDPGGSPSYSVSYLEGPGPEDIGTVEPAGLFSVDYSGGSLRLLATVTSDNWIAGGFRACTLDSGVDGGGGGAAIGFSDLTGYIAITQIEDELITNAKLANMAADTIKGRANGAGTGVPQDLTATQVRTILNVEDGADATDATNVAAAGAVMASAYTAADEVMVGTGAGTHAQVTLAASQILGKKATGTATNLTAADVRTILGVDAPATGAQDVSGAVTLAFGTNTTLVATLTNNITSWTDPTGIADGQTKATVLVNGSTYTVANTGISFTQGDSGVADIAEPLVLVTITRYGSVYVWTATKLVAP